MQLIIRGKNTQVTDAMRAAVHEKMERVRRHFDHIIDATVEFSVEKNRSIAEHHRVEVTIHVKGHYIRGEKSSEDMYGAIDAVMDKLERQVQKYKGRVYASKAAHVAANHKPVSIKELVPDLVPQSPVVRTKRFDLKPMSTEEAALQLDLLAHDFYLYRNVDTEAVNVVYRRHDGDYGVIEPS